MYRCDLRWGLAWRSIWPAAWTEPGDLSAVMLSRELRLVRADLRAQQKGDATGDVEAFLARIAAPDFGHAAD